MFGYVVINDMELKGKEVALYRSYYCGFCRKLRDKYGFRGQMTLSYDMTFLIMLLSDLYDAEAQEGLTKCIVHPLGKHTTRVNEFTEYAADMNIVLAYYNGLDDWEDEHKIRGILGAKLLKSGTKKVGINYGYKTAVIKDRLGKLHEAEGKSETGIDEAAGYFGDILGEIFAIYDDEWSDALRQVGFYLGKFIYIMDAYEDLEKDEKKGCWNPFSSEKGREDFDDYCKNILTMMISRCCEAFELLPCVEHLSILRNILYSGVWTRYNYLRMQKEEGKSADARGVRKGYSPSVFEDADILKAGHAEGKGVQTHDGSL